MTESSALNNQFYSFVNPIPDIYKQNNGAYPGAHEPTMSHSAKGWLAGSCTGIDDAISIPPVGLWQLREVKKFLRTGGGSKEKCKLKCKVCRPNSDFRRERKKIWAANSDKVSATTQWDRKILNEHKQEKKLITNSKINKIIFISYFNLMPNFGFLCPGW